jgi:hypothetical protein
MPNLRSPAGRIAWPILAAVVIYPGLDGMAVRVPQAPHLANLCSLPVSRIITERFLTPPVSVEKPQHEEQVQDCKRKFVDPNDNIQVGWKGGRENQQGTQDDLASQEPFGRDIDEIGPPGEYGIHVNRVTPARKRIPLLGVILMG